MRIADEDEVGLADLPRRQADGFEAGEPVEIRVEEQVEPGVPHAERRRPEPLQRRRCPAAGHALTPRRPRRRSRAPEPPNPRPRGPRYHPPPRRSRDAPPAWPRTSPP